MRKAALVLVWFAVSFLCWCGLRPWVAGGSERFYLLVLPALLALHGLLAPRFLAGLKRPLRWLLPLFAGLLLLTTTYTAFLSVRNSLPLSGFWPEALIVAYFAAAVAFLLVSAYGLLRRVLLLALCCRAGVAAPWRRLAAHLTAAALLAVVAGPYLIALAYVHRIKLPNLADPEALAGRPCEDVAFTSADGLTLRGWFFPCKDASSQRTLLVCHGMGANRSFFLNYVRVADAMNAHVLLFDFRGHGASDGHTVSLGYREKLDVLAAVDYLRRSRPGQARELIGLGVSMGSASLARAAAAVNPPLDAVILDSGFASAVDLTDSILSRFPAFVRPCMTGIGLPLASLHTGCPLYRVRPEEAVGRLRAPVLIVHADQDDLIPAEHARRLYRRAAEPKTLCLLPTVGHDSALQALPQYLDAVRHLLRQTDKTVAFATH